MLSLTFALTQMETFMRYAAIAASLLALAGCAQQQSPSNPYQPVPYVQIKHPEWSKNATIYELNTRQFTAEGTFKAAQQQLPRLKKLGVDIVWLMPINPIGVKHRKGELGSPYSVKDYYGVNPEFGTLADLKAFVAEAHKLGMHVILDWVANHSAWDNKLATEHPDWYAKDYKGDFHPTPWFDWSDIIDLNYDKPGLRKYMTDAMKYWVKEADVDGFRCDVAGYVPVDFWNEVRRELDKIKPVFMLAEWESRDLHAHAFDMTYAWSWYDAMHRVATGKANVGALAGYYSQNESAWPKNAMRMTFVSNHDKNSWEGTQFEAFGDALKPAIVLSVVGEGLPLIYNGQEAGNTKRLAFFKRDPIHWQPSPIGTLYQQLFKLKHENPALWNAHWGATMIKVPNNHESQVLSFVRQKDHDKVFAVMNFSAQPKTVHFAESLYQGQYHEYFSGQAVSFKGNDSLTLPAWSYRVYIGDK